MALEPAGVSLQAEGFNKYIKQLNTIDKVQQDIFDVDSSDVTKAFGSATKAADKYEKELKQVNKAQQQTRSSQKNLTTSLNNFSGGLTAAAGGLAAFATGAAVQFTAESAKISAQFEGQRTGLNNLAASYGQSGNEILAAIQTTSRGALSGLDAITAANQGLLLGVAKTPEEFAELTNSALTLGRTLGLKSTQAIDQFTSALGRQSLLILDNFGISAKQVNAEIERLAQADFGKARSELTEAQKQATFMKAALNIAGEAAAVIGEEAGAAQASFDRLEAAGQNLQVTFGTLARPLATGISDALARAATTAQQFFAFLGAGFTSFGTIATGVFGNIVNFFKGEATRSIDDILDEAGIAAIDRFKQIASTIEGVSFPNDEAKQFTQNLEDQNQELKEAAINIDAYAAALQQAESLQLSFARAAEDAAIKQARAAEDVARSQQKAVSNLESRQAKERDKLLSDQIKQLEKFDADRQKQIKQAEADVAKERKKARDQRRRDEKKLFQDLEREREKFNLSQLQSERRFSLSERRLRAEGDILALQQLREDRELERQEEKENFDLGQKDQKQSGLDQIREQEKVSNERINELKASLEDQRAELLKSFDEQVEAQRQAQIEAQELQRQRFAEDAVNRQIALQREEEDRRLSQQRQLEDLGRSFAEQEGVTVEGTTAIANQLERVFGIDGTADSIISGFTAKTENEFTDLFKNLEKIVSEAEIDPEPAAMPIRTTTGAGGFGGRIGGIPEFQEGGIVPGPIGAPQIVQAHGGETILPTHQSSFTMAAPVIPSQNLNVNMSGGFNITGEGQANEAILQAAAREMTDNFRIAVQRLARRN